MFDEILRELRRLEKPVSVPIDMPLDDKGYFDRKCPHEECGTDFNACCGDTMLRGHSTSGERLGGEARSRVDGIIRQSSEYHGRRRAVLISPLS